MAHSAKMNVLQPFLFLCFCFILYFDFFFALFSALFII